MHGKTILGILLITLIFMSGCTSSNPIQGQNSGLASNGKSIEVNLIKSNIISEHPTLGSMYEYIFEVENTGETGITIFHPYDPNGEGANYDVWLEDYGGFRHDVMVYGVYERLEDGSYKNNMKNVGGVILKMYPKEKILIGCAFRATEADIDKLKVKTILHFSFGKKSERTWDVTSLFTQR